MRVYSAPVAATLALTAALVLGGCKSSNPPAPTQPDNASQTTPPPANPSTPSPDQGMAPSSSAAPPAAQSAPPPPPPSMAEAPAPAPMPAPAPPPPPAPVKLTARAGSSVSVTITESLSAKNSNVGDRFTGVLAAPLKSSGGSTIFPRGAHVAGTVVAAKGRGKFKGAGDLGITVTEIAGMSVNTSEYEKTEKGKGKRTAGFIGGGTGAGALIGGLAGGGKGALIGGLAGAGAGTAGAVFTGNKDVVIPSETTITFTLQSPVTVTK